MNNLFTFVSHSLIYTFSPVGVMLGDVAAVKYHWYSVEFPFNSFMTFFKVLLTNARDLVNIMQT